jgi:hypothetical protein
MGLTGMSVYKPVDVIQLHPGSKTPAWLLAAQRKVMRETFATLPEPRAENSIKLLRCVMTDLLANITWTAPGVTRDGVITAMVAGVLADLATYDRLIDQVELPP